MITEENYSPSAVLQMLSSIGVDLTLAINDSFYQHGIDGESLTTHFDVGYKNQKFYDKYEINIDVHYGNRDTSITPITRFRQSDFQFISELSFDKYGRFTLGRNNPKIRLLNHWEVDLYSETYGIISRAVYEVFGSYGFKFRIPQPQ